MENEKKKQFKFSFETDEFEIAGYSPWNQEKYWLLYDYYLIKAFLLGIPRRVGKLFLPKKVYIGPILDNGNPIGFYTKKGKKVFYGKQYRVLYFFGMV